jgi:aerobic-type carbon monoxide dehydrogenase small subunit (CoxS/CutS family)
MVAEQAFAVPAQCTLTDARMRSCQVQISAAEGANIVTIEGLSPDSSHPLQKASITEEVPQKKK